MKNEWRGFKGSHWTEDIDVRAFIQDNYTAYDGNADFLAGPTEALISFGHYYKAFKKKKEQRVEFLMMETKLCQV